MHKHRPLGVTILAYWALVGSVVTFALNAIYLAGNDLNTGAFAIIRGSLGVLSAPLGSGLALTINFYLAIPFAIFLAIVGLHTLLGRKWAWFANVGLSVAVLAQNAGGLLSLALFTNASIVGMIMPVSFIAVSLLRLYYLFRPNVRDYFNAWSIFAQKRTV